MTDGRKTDLDDGLKLISLYTRLTNTLQLGVPGFGTGGLRGLMLPELGE